MECEECESGGNASTILVSRNLIVRQCKERKTGISEGGNPRMEQSISRFINDNHTR